MKTLFKNQLSYLCDSEEEATDLINNFKENQTKEHYTVSKYKTDLKKKKNKETKEEFEYYVVVIEKKYEDAEDSFFN